MGNILRRSYFRVLTPAILGFVLVSLAKRFELIHIGHIPHLELFAPIVFVLSVVFAIAFPILFRVIFAHRLRFEKGLSKNDLIRFERNCIYIALVTPYLAFIAYLLGDFFKIRSHTKMSVNQLCPQNRGLMN